MNNNYDSSKFKIVVGIDFEPHTNQLLEYCKELSNNSGAKLRLTHAVEPWKEHPWITTYPGVNYYSLAREAENSARNDADMQLISITQNLNGYNTESNVVVGPIADVLQADALSSSCSLIVLGIRNKIRDYRLMPNSFSTVLSLLSHAKVPVLVVPHEYSGFKKHERLKILFADDFSENCKAPLKTAMHFATGMGNVDFHHLHASNQSEGEIRETGERILEMMNMDTIPFDQNFSIDDFYHQTQSSINKSMIE